MCQEFLSSMAKSGQLWYFNVNFNKPYELKNIWENSLEKLSYFL
jgi:hypothetical protein